MILLFDVCSCARRDLLEYHACDSSCSIYNMILCCMKLLFLACSVWRHLLCLRSVHIRARGSYDTTSLKCCSACCLITSRNEYACDACVWVDLKQIEMESELNCRCCWYVLYSADGIARAPNGQFKIYWHFPNWHSSFFEHCHSKAMARLHFSFGAEKFKQRH